MSGNGRLPALPIQCLAKAIVIGCGFAGTRFIRTLKHLQAQDATPVQLAGVVDTDPKKLIAIDPSLQPFSNVGQALQVIDPAVAIVAVDTAMHYQVLEELGRSSVRAILCEKPLTRTLNEARALKPLLQDRMVAINLVERFSPAVSAARMWLEENPGFMPTRIEFFWGKYRFRDPRPTIGVESEIIHPLDLVHFLFRQELDHVRSTGIVSNIQHRPNAPPVLDSIDVLFQGQSSLVVGHSSLMWPQRDRRIVAYLHDQTRLVRMGLEFDNPDWDCDEITISEIDRNSGIANIFLNKKWNDQDFSAELNQIHKVGQFILAALRIARGESPVICPPDYLEAVQLQYWLEKISESAITIRSRPGPNRMADDGTPSQTARALSRPESAKSD